jgi:uncharacterized surface protein with fasciclin (FAS1) repeats
MQFKSVILSLSATLAGSAAAMEPDLMTLLNESESLSTLKMMLGKYPDMLKMAGVARNTTILAPTNEAFGKMRGVDGYTEPSKEALVAILGYHVLEGMHPASSIMKAPMFLNTMMSEYMPYRNLMGDKQVCKVMKGDNGVMVYGGLDRRAMVTKAVCISLLIVFHISQLILPRISNSTMVACI